MAVKTVRFHFDGTFMCDDWTEMPTEHQVTETLRAAINNTAYGVVTRIEVERVDVSEFQDWAPRFMQAGPFKAEVSVGWETALDREIPREYLDEI